MAVGDFDTYYPSNPWGSLVTNQRQYYEAMLMQEYWMQHVVFNRFVEYQFNLGDVNAKTMTLTSLVQPHQNFDTVGLTQMWLPSSRIDSRSRDVTFNHYAGKLAFDKYSRLVTYWKQDNMGGLDNIVSSALGPHLTGVLEKLARNAFLGHAQRLIGSGSMTGFDQVGSSNTLSSSLIEDIHLGMAERGVEYAINPMGRSQAIFCVTTPGVIRTVRESATDGDWIDIIKYANPTLALGGEVGTWKGVRFLQTNEACLYNTGTQEYQVTVDASLTQGSGAPDPASGTDLGVYKVGQTSGVTNYITVSDTSGMAVNDIVTIHATRSSAYGVTNGVSPTDGKAEVRRIVSIIDSTTFTVDRPIMEDFTTDLGSGVYGYVTKGRHIHMAAFIGGPGGVASGVSQSPEIHTPNDLGVIDDVGMMYRFSWDGYLGYAPFTPEVYEVWTGAAKNRTWGAAES